MKVFLHVGLPKAASTSLQLWLETHRADFLAQGVYIPDSGHRADRHVPEGRTLSHDVLARMMHWPWPLRFWIDRYLHEAEALGAGSVVLTTENLAHPANIGDLPRFAATLQRHLIGRHGAGLEVILITRDPEAWVQSFHSEAVMDGRGFETRSLERFRAEMQARGLSPEALAEVVERSFDAPIHRLDLDTVSGPTLFHRLSGVFGTAEMPPPARRERMSPTPEALEAQRQINAALRARPWRVGAHPRTFLRVVLSSCPEKPYLAMRRAIRLASSFVAFTMLTQRR